MKRTEQSLSAKIENLVREHIMLLQAEAAASVARAFEKTAKQKAVRKCTPAHIPAKKHRSKEEILEQTERLHGAILAKPGATMMEISEHLGLSAIQLHGSMMRLKDAKRVRSSGERQFTRYFPIFSES
jgi:phosphoribosylanthranilate isomerase